MTGNSRDAAIETPIIQVDAEIGRPSNDARDEIVAAFESVADWPYDGKESDWDAVLELLSLPLSYQPAVSLALKDGRWRSAKDPKAYVATVAWRMALKHNLGNRQNREVDYGPGPVSELVVPMLDEDGHEMSYEDQMDRLTFCAGYDWEESLYDRVPDWLRDSDGEVEWTRVAEFAVRKEAMADAVGLVLQCQALGMSRENLLATALDDAERRDLQAASRWVDRNWETRIVPLFRRERPPEPEPNPPNQTVEKSSQIRPWETIKRVCAKSQPRIG